LDVTTQDVTTQKDDFGPLCGLSEIRKGEGKHFRPQTGRWRNKAMAVFEENGNIYVTNFICPHSGGPISDGTIKDGVIECPWHGWQYDASTGLSADRAGDGHDIEVYETKVEGDQLLVGGIKKSK
jgi:nitrite reductase/ring-hydroxylating ferredoxin subunit